jgi:hypothetical protein
MKNSVRALLLAAALVAGVAAAPSAMAASAASAFTCHDLTPYNVKFELNSPAHWLPEGASPVKFYTDAITQKVRESCVNTTYHTQWWRVGLDPGFIYDGYRL